MKIKSPLLILNSTKENEEIKKIILKYFPNSLTEKEPDVIFSVGGDGTILHAAKNYGDKNIPFFGIANGTLNFIPNHLDNWDEYFQKIINNEVELEEENTFYLSVVIEKADGNKLFYKAVNDVVIGGDIMDYFHFNLLTEDSTFKNKKISSGGICISTPLGSTAYHYNNGGTIIPSLNLPLLAITTIVSNRKDRINKMFSSKQKLLIELNNEKENRDNCLVFIDGKTKIVKLEKNDKMYLSEGSQIKFLFTDLKAFEMKRLTY